MDNSSGKMKQDLDTPRILSQKTSHLSRRRSTGMSCNMATLTMYQVFFMFLAASSPAYADWRAGKACNNMEKSTGPFKDACVYISDFVAIPTYAKLYCQNVYGGELAHIPNNYIEDFLSADFMVQLGNPQIWVSDGRNLEGASECPYVHNFNTHMFLHASCTENKYFLCQVKQGFQRPTTTGKKHNTKGCNLDVWDDQWKPIGNSCYYTTNGKTFDEAKEYCKSVFKASMSDIKQELRPSVNNCFWIPGKKKDGLCPMKSPGSNTIKWKHCLNYCASVCKVDKKTSVN